jgi:hypothetical protein
MRSLVAMSFLVALTLGCDAAEPATDAAAPAPTSSIAPDSNEGVEPAPTPTAAVLASPVVPASPPQPMPVDVCRRVREVGDKDHQPGASVLDEVERDCVAALERVRTQYDTLMICLLEAKTDSDVAACDHSMRNWTDLLSKADPKPTALDVCNHFMDMMKREYGDSGDPKALEDCLADIAELEEKVGAEKHDAQMKCVMAVTKIDDMVNCYEREDRPSKAELEPEPKPIAKPTASELCDHLTQIMKREFEKYGVEPTADDKDLFPDENCAADIEKEKQTMDPEQYDARSACIVKAEDLESLVECRTP